MPLFANNFESFGLDIGDRSLKTAFIRKIAGKPALLSYNSYALPAGILESGRIKNQKELAVLIKKLLAGARGKKISTPYVNICLPETKTFIKLITIKKAEPEKIKEALAAELPNHIPLSVSDLALDWQTVEEKNGSLRILVGAVPKEIVDDYVNMALAAGLKPMSLQIEAEAILRSVLPLRDAPGSPLCLVDLGASRSGFILYDKGSIQFTVSLPIAGERMTALVADKLKLAPSEAERAKKICGLDPSRCQGAVNDILLPVIAELAAAVKKNIAFYSEHFPDAAAVENIILCGGSSNLKNLKPLLAEQMPGATVHYGNPLLNIGRNYKKRRAEKNTKVALDFLNPTLAHESPAKGGSAPLTAEESSTFATAIGLALANVSL